MNLDQIWFLGEIFLVRERSSGITAIKKKKKKNDKKKY
jgi:hypothetical protein